MVKDANLFRIGRGIARYHPEASDYYAVLGLPITADASQIRRRYLSIAKNLHPDIHGRSPEEKAVATQYLSKMVNPAYTVLTQERERSEYTAIFKLLAKRLIKKNQIVQPQSDLAKRLLYSPKESNYEQFVLQLAKLQYESLGKILDYAGDLSELNLVHVLLLEGYSPVVREAEDTAIQPRKASIHGGTNHNPVSSSTTPTAAASATPTSQSSSEAKPQPKGNAQPHIKQAEALIQQKQWAPALKELRAALQLDCNNSHSHALLGLVYMNQKLTGMAKVSFQQALKLNPAEPIALQNLGKLDGTQTSGDRTAKGKDPSKKGGFFGWLGN